MSVPKAPASTVSICTASPKSPAQRARRSRLPGCWHRCVLAPTVVAARSGQPVESRNCALHTVQCHILAPHNPYLPRVTPQGGDLTTDCIRPPRMSVRRLLKSRNTALRLTDSLHLLGLSKQFCLPTRFVLGFEFRVRVFTASSNVSVKGAAAPSHAFAPSRRH
jgi:hypothetical protein